VTVLGAQLCYWFLLDRCILVCFVERIYEKKMRFLSLEWKREEVMCGESGDECDDKLMLLRTVSTAAIYQKTHLSNADIMSTADIGS